MVVVLLGEINGVRLDVISRRCRGEKKHNSRERGTDGEAIKKKASRS